MTIKQSAALLVLMAAVTLAGAGCLSRPAATPSEPEPVPAVEQESGDERNDATPVSDIDTSGWVRYASSQAGQIGMSFLYPPELTPVKWDTEAWGPGAVGVDFGGFGVARIPNPERLSVEGWLAKNYSEFAFDVSPANRESDPFANAVTDGACEAVVVTDDFDEDAGLSGIGGTMFVSAGDASLYAFTLGQDWNQELGGREAVIEEITASVEWFAERTDCGNTVTVRDDRVGVSFEVPAAFAPVVVEDEYGWGAEETEDTEAYTCLAHRMFFADLEEAEPVFLAVKDTWECGTLGRGGYWGDQAGGFATEDDIRKWCEAKDSCDTFVNKNGITIYHARSNTVEDWGTTLTDVDEYAAWNPNRSIHGVLISDQGILSSGAAYRAGEVASIANSLSFIE